MEGYAEICVNDHNEIWLLKSKEFRNYLSKAFYDQHAKPPGSQGLQNALAVLQGNAQFDSPEKSTFVRLAEHGGSIYLDMCNDRWEAIEINSQGWQIVKVPPVPFRRPRGMLALPEPLRGGHISELRNIINVRKDHDWVLIVSWLIGAFSPSGPYPILLVHGEQGSAKSTTARILRELIDPSAAPLRTLPRSERDLMIMAKNAWIIAFDNLSGVKPWLSDALCRLSTGGGFSTRGLHTDSDEVIFDAERPMLMNGIDNIANRQDLASRSLVINLPRIPADKRKLENDLWRELDEMKPKILGSILDTISFTLGNMQNVRLDSYPRMADFAKWVVAAEPNLPWENGKFLKYYQDNGQTCILPRITNSTPGKYRNTDFVRLDNDRVVQCPAGKHSTKKMRHKYRILFRFPAEQCNMCTQKSRCTDCNNGRLVSFYRGDYFNKASSLAESTFGKKLLQARQIIVEGVIGEAKNLHLLNRCRYRRLDRLKMQLFLTGSVINLKRLIKYKPSGKEIAACALHEEYRYRKTCSVTLKAA